MPTLTSSIPFSLAQAICAEGVSSQRIGYMAAQVGLINVEMGEGQPHFTWDEKALNKRGVAFLERMLANLREAHKEQTDAR